MANIIFDTEVVGALRITEENQKISRIEFLQGNSEELDGADIFTPEDIQGINNPVLRKTAIQIQEYLDGEREEFTIPIQLKGTPFTEEVWTALLDIPYGEICSYKELAEAIGRPNACRAVGMANNKNPLPIIIPCHRVIGSDGRLIGYAAGLDIKSKLLSIERRRVLSQIFVNGEIEDGTDGRESLVDSYAATI